MAELALLRAGADTLEGSAGLAPVDVMPGRNKARDFLAMTGNRHFFAALDPSRSRLQALALLS